jgi:hypothetical protein
MKPLLFLDVDGPLNPWAANKNRRPVGYETHRMRPSGWTVEETRKPLRVWLNPSHGSYLLGLPFELVWATTWGREANEWIGPHIGLPELPVVEWDLSRRPASDRLEGGVYWKTPQLVEYAAGRPFAWVDDEITEDDRVFVAEHHPGAALLQWISPRLGLIDSDVHDLHVWASKLPDPADEQGEPVDFLSVAYPDGSQRTRLDRLTDGRIMCCLCFEWCTREELADDEEPGMKTDVCQPCAEKEKLC